MLRKETHGTVYFVIRHYTIILAYSYTHIQQLCHKLVSVIFSGFFLAYI